MTRTKLGVVSATGVVVALCVAGCSGAVSGGAAAPSVPAIGSSTAPASSPVPEPSSTAPSSSPAQQPEAATATDCKASELRLSLGRGDAAAGTVYRPLRFANVGGRTCTIQGFPGVSYVAGSDEHQVGPAAFRVGEKGPAISLTPGMIVNAPVGFTQVRNFDPAVCRPTAVNGLRVYPPHDTASVIVAMDGLGCAGNPPGNQLVVKTVQSGSGV